MAASTGKNPISARKLLQSRTDFQRKFFNSYQNSKKAAHMAIDAAQAAYDKRLKVLQDELIARCVKKAGEPDAVQDPELLKDVYQPHEFAGLDENRQPTHRYDICELKPHIALALARNPDFLDEPLTIDVWVYIAETALGEELKTPSTKDIQIAEQELTDLKTLLDELKHTQFGKPIRASIFDEDAVATYDGMKTYSDTPPKGDNSHNYHDGMSQRDINAMSNSYGRKPDIKPNTPVNEAAYMAETSRTVGRQDGGTHKGVPDGKVAHFGQTGTELYDI